MRKNMEKLLEDVRELSGIAIEIGNINIKGHVSWHTS